MTPAEAVEPENEATPVVEPLLPFPEARAMRPPVMEGIEDSERTVRTVGRWENGELIAVTPEEWSARQEDPLHHTQLQDHLTTLLEEVSVVTMRDEEEIIQAVVLDGESMDTCALLFHSGLIRRFEDILGPEFLVAVPSRFRLYLFPKLATEIQTFAPMVLSDFRATAYPVSPEVFEVSANGVRAVGILDDR
jgi:hypothetical protein